MRNDFHINTENKAEFILNKREEGKSSLNIFFFNFSISQNKNIMSHLFCSIVHKIILSNHIFLSLNILSYPFVESFTLQRTGIINAVYNANQTGKIQYHIVIINVDFLKIWFYAFSLKTSVHPRIVWITYQRWF